MPTFGVHFSDPYRVLEINSENADFSGCILVAVYGTEFSQQGYSRPAGRHRPVCVVRLAVAPRADNNGDRGGQR